MKKHSLLVCVLIVVAAAAFANGTQESVTLEFAIRETGPTLEAYKELVAEFNASADGIEVEIVTYGKDYGSTMKTRMASNSLPDLFTTHGWSVFLYGEYLRPLNDQSWVDGLRKEIVPTVTDLDGNIVVLPFDIDITGLIYNADVLAEFNLPVPTSLDEMVSQFPIIKGAGKVPIGLGGKNTSDIAGMIGRLALPMLTTSKEQDYSREFYDGTFDWKKFDQVGETLLSFKNKGFLNIDSLTGDKDVVYAGLANGEIAYSFQSNATIVEVKKINPEANVSMMAIPGYKSGDEPILISGERNAVGIWKDSDNVDEALEFLAFLAEPRNVQRIAESYGNPPSYKSIESSDEFISMLLDKLSHAQSSNHFDREYLPNGMWGTLKEYGGGVLSEAMSIKEGRELMESEYLRLKNIR